MSQSIETTPSASSQTLTGDAGSSGNGGNEAQAGAQNKTSVSSAETVTSAAGASKQGAKGPRTSAETVASTVGASKQGAKGPKISAFLDDSHGYKPVTLIAVSFKEAVLDSPTFRASMNHVNEQLDSLDRWIESFSKALNKMSQEMDGE